MHKLLPEMIKPLMPRLATSLVFAIFIILFQSVKAQEYGGNPPSVKWLQVNTPQVKVIFPYGQDSVGRRVANIISQINSRIQPSLGYRQKQVSVLLQNKTTTSNAFVQLAPFRSIFYLMPQSNSFDLGSLGWADQLAIHEYRHIQQYNNFNVGLSKALHVVFGEGGQAVGNALSVPNWFFEGDAVYNETLVSNQGRGRLPYFLNGYRSIWAAGKDYSYMKLRNGSYRDYTPNHYELGYMLVAYGRQQHGGNFWKAITHDAAAYNSLFYPFQKSFEKHAGISFNAFRNNALNTIKTTFNDKPDPSLKYKHFVADEEYPAYVGDNKIVYLKTTYSRRSTFMLRDGDHEKPIRIRDVSMDNYFSYRNGKIVYAAYKADLRWGYQNYSDLRVLNINTGEQHNLTNRTKYFSPDINADGSQVVAVQVDASQRSTLHIINTIDGKVATVIPNGTDVFYTYPKFFSSTQIATAIRKKNGNMVLALVDIKTGTLDELTPEQINPIGFISVSSNTVYFTATDVTDKLFAYDVAKRKLYVLQGDALLNGIGNYQPTVTGDRLAFTSFTATGYHINQVNLSNLQRQERNNFEHLSEYGMKVLDTGAAANLLAMVKNEALPITKYNKAHGLFNFHSLVPDFNDPNYSITLEGENVLGTTQTSLLFNYNRDEGYKEAGAAMVYNGLFPYIRGAVTYTADRKGYNSKTASNAYWNEFQARIGAGVPLNFTSGRRVTSLRFGTDVVYANTRFQDPYRSQFNDRNYTYLSNYLTFSNRVVQQVQNIYPRFAQSISIGYKYAITNLSASQVNASATFYLPGLAVNHNLVLTGAFQQNQRDGVIRFANSFPYSRGYSAENLYRLSKFGVNYHFPIAYPDAGFANLIFLQRLRGNMFFDYTHADDFYTNGKPFKADFRTVGAEVYFDTSWFNQVPLTFGLRFSRLLDDDLFGGYGRNRVELIVPLTFF